MCGALHRVGWQHKGDTGGGMSSWFARGDKPSLTRIEVQRSRLADYLVVNIEWAVLTNPPHMGRQTINIDCTFKASDVQIQEACERAVVRCLEVMRDVVTGEGVASTTKGITNESSSEPQE